MQCGRSSAIVVVRQATVGVVLICGGRGGRKVAGAPSDGGYGGDTSQEGVEAEAGTTMSDPQSGFKAEGEALNRDGA